MSERPSIEPDRHELRARAPYVFEVERRTFLRLVGGGLVVAAAATGTAAQESGRGGSRDESPSGLQAWVHVTPKGDVVVYTGKVEIGQNTRTTLTQTVADELRVPVASVSLVMGDTRLTPYDRGTFGSQSTPRMAPQLARAAATAREILIDRAAARWKADRASLKAANGRVQDASGHTLTYAELVATPLDGTVREDAPVGKPAEWTLRGTPVPKVNARDIVTGAHRYPIDVTRPGMLFGRVLRPPKYGATLVSLDDSAARAMAGVKVVRDGEFAGVVAPTSRLAAKALTALRAEWSAPAPQASAAELYEHLRKGVAPNPDERAGDAPRVAGDVEQARTGAARTFDTTYRIPYIAHVPLEPRVAVAEWTPEGLSVWTGTQRPFGVQEQLMDVFRLPADRVRVQVPDTGSAYGGKHTGEATIEAARLAKAAGGPVKVQWTRLEEFSWGYLRPAGVIGVRTAVDGAGRMVAWEFDNWNSGTAGIECPYDIGARRIAYHASDSPLRQGSYRGLAATANHFAREMHMDEVARALGVDRVEFRLRHLSNERLKAVLTTAAAKAGWPNAADGRALGIACGTEKGSYVATVAELSRLDRGFRVERLVVVFECGAVVNPNGLKNQVEGAVIQGLGGALFEAIDFADGEILNGTIEQYRVPRFKDVPRIETHILDRRDLPSAGAGETPIVCVAPAIGSAAREFGEVAPEMPVRLKT